MRLVASTTPGQAFFERRVLAHLGARHRRADAEPGFAVC
jgi:hypothetical protein